MAGFREGSPFEEVFTTFWVLSAETGWRRVATSERNLFATGPGLVTNDMGWIIETRGPDDVGRAHAVDDETVIELGEACTPGTRYDVETGRFLCLDPPRLIDISTGDVTELSGVPNALDPARSGFRPDGGLAFYGTDGSISWTDSLGRPQEPPAGTNDPSDRLLIPHVDQFGTGPVRVVAATADGVATLEDGAFELSFPGARLSDDALLVNYSTDFALLTLVDGGARVYGPDGTTIDPIESLPPMPAPIQAVQPFHFALSDDRVVVEYLVLFTRIPAGADSNQQAAVWVLDRSGRAEWTLLAGTAAQFVEPWLVRDGRSPQDAMLEIFDTTTSERTTVQADVDGSDWAIEYFVSIHAH